ncbi:MAG: diguanylate cyclase [Candidatus Omnitrophota bacterium]|nr:MAG: diguanylate cyclase [Candidatus Omnitrophota bacterium]
MDYFRLSALINCFILVFIGAYSYLNNRTNKLNQIWCLFNMVSAIWFASIYIVNTIADKQIALNIVRLAHPLSILCGLIFFLFCLYYIDVEQNKRRLAIAAYGVGLTAIFIESFWPSLIVADVVPKFYQPYTPKGTNLYIIHFSLIIAFITMSFYELIRAYRHASSYKRNQLKYFFLATFVAAFSMSTVLPMALDLPVYPFGFFLFPLYGIIITYSIVRYRLMDIIVLMNRTVFFTAVIMPAIIVHIILVWLLQPKFPYFVSNAFSITAISIVFLITPQYRKNLQLALNSILYKGKYDYQDVLKESAKALVTMLDLNQLLDYLVNTIVKNIRVNKVSLLLEDEESKEYKVAASFGIPKEQAESIRLKPINGIIGYLTNKPATLVREEAERELSTPQLEKIKKDMDEIGAEIMMPLICKNKLVGILNLDNKSSGGFYDPSDIDILDTLANEAAIAIENARLYRQAITDGLTKLYHHQHFMARLNEETERSKRYERPMSLLMIDLDHFKDINDKFGHQAGDVALQKVALILKNNLRNVDICGRYGGEEFALILPETAVKGAKNAAERLRNHVENAKDFAEKIRQTIAKSSLKHENSTLSLTISVGITFYDGQDKTKTAYDLIKEADSALYLAKRMGRNRVVEFSR